MAEVRIEGIFKRFGDVEAVSDLSLTVGNGEFLVLLGPTGAGKTTLLRLVAGLEAPDRGAIFIGGRDVARVPAAARDTAFVFQQYSLYPHLSVFDNLAFPLRAPVRRVPEPEIRRKVDEVATLLGIEAKLANRATQLSGGQMQRVAIGRALVRDPAVFLMDEPLSSLDAKLRADLRIELKRVQRELGATIIYVTHDQIEAMTMATRVGIMDAGRLIQVGTAREIYKDPLSAYVAQRLGQPAINLLPASLFAGQVPPQAATVGARTEHILLRKGGQGVQGRIKRVEHLGDQSYIHIDAGGHALTTLADPDAPFEAGDGVAVELRQPLLFDAAGARLRS